MLIGPGSSWKLDGQCMYILTFVAELLAANPSPPIRVPVPATPWFVRHPKGTLDKLNFYVELP